MIPNEVVEIMSLQPSDREVWTAHFLDNRGSGLGARSIFGVPFPVLGHDQRLADYYSGLYDACGDSAGCRDKLREPVVNLIRTGCSQYQVSDACGVLARLVTIAASCGFTEVESTLWGWISADAYRGVELSDEYRGIPLQTLLWQALLSWGAKLEWLPMLTRDVLQRDSSPLCFRALANLDIAQAIAHLPLVCRLDHVYVRTLLHEFLETKGAHVLLDNKFQQSWQTCLSTIEHDSDIAYLLDSEGFGRSDNKRKNPTLLWQSLNDAGIVLSRNLDQVHLMAPSFSVSLSITLLKSDKEKTIQDIKVRVNQEFRTPAAELMQTLFPEGTLRIGKKR